MQNNLNRPSTPQEWRLLKNLKLSIFAVGLIFFFHALAGGFAQEAFPLTRWTMFSGRIGIPEWFVRRDLEILTVNGEIFYLPYQSLYSGTAMNQSGVSQEMVFRLVRSGDVVMPEMRHAVFDRLEFLYDTEIVSFDLIEYRYYNRALDDINLEVVGEPDETILLATVTREQIILHVDEIK